MRIMNTTLLPSFLTSVLLCFSAALPLHAQGPGRGPGKGGGPGAQGGFQEAIHKLFANHEKVKRTVEMTDTGYKSRTVSDDPDIAKTLQKHVREMRARLGAGMRIRRWDPAFAELVEHYKDIDHDFKEVEGGVEMIAKGKTPDAVKVAQNHAKIVSGFVKKGPDQMHETHAKALGGDEKEEPKDQDNEKKSAAPGCPKCAVGARPDAPAGENTDAKAVCPDCQSSAGPECSSENRSRPEALPR